LTLSVLNPSNVGLGTGSPRFACSAREGKKMGLEKERDELLISYFPESHTLANWDDQNNLCTLEDE